MTRTPDTITQGWSALDCNRAAMDDATLDTATRVTAAGRVIEMTDDPDERLRAEVLRFFLDGEPT